MEYMALTRPSRRFFLLLLMVSVVGTPALFWARVWRWRGVEPVVRAYAQAVLAGDHATLARLGVSGEPAGKLLRLAREDPEGARRCLGSLHFAEAQRTRFNDVFLLFSGPEGCPLGHAPAVVIVRRVDDGWKIQGLYFPLNPPRNYRPVLGMH